MAEPLKNEFSPEFISELSSAILRQWDDFRPNAFSRQVLGEGWDRLELKERIERISFCLRKGLPEDYRVAVDILIGASCGFKGLPALVFPDFVGRYGLEHWAVSVKALRVFTPLCSSEFGVRPFLQKDTDRMLKQFKAWTRHRYEHVRRLASEGCRLYLPWAPRVEGLENRLDDICEILESLKSDESLYVRRSVANNLNDISKLDTERAIALARKWIGDSPETDWVVKHAMRGLLKKGRPEVLQIFGYGESRSIASAIVELEKRSAKIGGSLGFRASVSSRKRELGLTRVEFVVGYVKANGKISEKVFMLHDGSIADAERTWEKRISFKDLSTRKHYPGVHTLCLAVNGKRFPKQEFRLKVPRS